MQETYELRVDEDFAGQVFASNEGKKLGIIRLVRLDPSDARIPEIIRLQHHIEAPRAFRSFMAGTSSANTRRQNSTPQPCSR